MTFQAEICKKKSRQNEVKIVQIVRCWYSNQEIYT